MTRDKGQHSQISAADLRMETDLEADPILRSSVGKASPLQIGILSIIVIVIVGVVVWAIS